MSSEHETGGNGKRGANGAGGANGASAAARPRDTGLLVARSEVSAINQIFALPPEERTARLIAFAREQHAQAERRARAQVARILDED